MFELVRISLHNWYLVDALDIPVEKHAAIIGQTGAGKSSILDAIQTVLSGNNRNVIELNAAAGNQKSRSVKDYMHGCVSDVQDGAPRRQRCESTLALTFYDQGLNRRVTVGVMLSVEPDLPETTKRFILLDHDFKIESFMTGAGHIATHKEMLAQQEGKLTLYPNSTKFVGAYLETMRPSTPPDPRRFMRSFSNALQAKEISDPTDFVRRFVLDPLPVDIQSVRTSIATWREMADEVIRIEQRIAALSTIKDSYTKAYYINSLSGEVNVASAQLNLLNSLSASNEIEDEFDQVTELAQMSAQHEFDIEQQEAEISGRLDAIRRRMAGQSQSSIIGTTDAQISVESERQRSLSRQIEIALRPYQEVRSLGRSITGLPKPLIKIADDAQKLSQITTNRQPDEIVRAQDEISSLLFSVKGLGEVSHVLDELHDIQSDTLRNVRHRQGELEEIMSSAGDQRVSSEVRRFIEALRDEGVAGTAIPEAVQLENTSWASAIESVLGDDVQSVGVDPSDLIKAHELLIERSTDFPNVRLINFTAAGTDDAPQQSGLAAMIRSDVPAISWMLQNRLGALQPVDDNEPFTSKAVHRSGFTTALDLLKPLSTRTPILGGTTHIDPSEELAELKDQEGDLRHAVSLLRAAYAAALQVSTSDPAEITELLSKLTASINRMRRLKKEMSELSVAPDAVDANEEISAKEELASIQSSKRNLSDQRRDLEVRAGILKNEITKNHDLIAKLREQVDQAIQATATVEMVTMRALSSMDHRAEVFHEIEEGNYLTKANQSLKALKLDLEGRGDVNVHLRLANNGLLTYIQTWLPDDTPFDDSQSDLDRFVWVTQSLTTAQDHELLGHKQALSDAKVVMEKSLKEGLIGRLGEQFAMMEQQLDNLNRRLGLYQFVGQTYQFRSQVSSEFSSLHGLIERYSSPTFNLDDDSDWKNLEELLLESDDVRRLEDYRQYFTYELFIEHPDPADPSKTKSSPFSAIVGKLSGGQRQAPYYVAIAASLVSAYYPKGQDGDTEGMGLLVFDEAFNKLDIPNTQRLVELFRSLGLQVVVAAPEEKRSSLMECVESVISVSRSPGSADVFLDQVRIGPKAWAAMKAENPIHNRPLN